MLMRLFLSLLLVGKTQFVPRETDNFEYGAPSQVIKIKLIGQMELQHWYRQNADHRDLSLSVFTNNSNECFIWACNWLYTTSQNLALEIAWEWQCWTGRSYPKDGLFLSVRSRALRHNHHWHVVAILGQCSSSRGHAEGFWERLKVLLAEDGVH